MAGANETSYRKFHDTNDAGIVEKSISYGEARSQRGISGAALLTALDIGTGEASFSPRWGLKSAALGEHLFIFGGYYWSEELEVYFNDLYMLNSKTQKISFVSPALNPSSSSSADSHSYESSCPEMVPEARFGCVLESCEDTRTLFLQGGRHSAGCSNDLWKFSVDSKRWVKLWPSSETESVLAPSSRCWHSSAFLDGCLYIYGGWDASGAVLSDLWKFDTVDLSWTLLSSTPGIDISDMNDQSLPLSGSSTRTPASPTTSSTIAVDNTQCTSSRSSIQPHANDTPEVVPGCRSCHNSAIWENGFYVFGGLRSGSALADSEVRRFDLKTKMWSTVKPSVGFTLRPRSRISAASVLVDNLWIFHGGLTTYPQPSARPNSEVIVFDLRTNTWAKFNEVPVLTPSARHRNLPTATCLSRYGHCGSYVPSLGSAVFFGGADSYATATVMSSWRLDLVPSMSEMWQSFSTNISDKSELKAVTRRLGVVSESLSHLVARMDDLEADRNEWKQRAQAQAQDNSVLVQTMQALQIQVQRQADMNHSLQLLMGTMQNLGQSLCNIWPAHPIGMNPVHQVQRGAPAVINVPQQQCMPQRSPSVSTHGGS